VAKRILIVDDSSSNILLLSNFLNSEGYDVQTAAGGREALKLVSESKPDLILLDIMMPDIDGISVLKKLRSDETTARLPVIVVSAVGETERIEAIKAIGVTDYLIKPIDFDIIRDKVEAIFI
jgi:CheY-like chemotaxis protein